VGEELDFIPEHHSYTRMTAEVYDVIYSDKDYAGETEKLKGVIASRLESGGRELLEVACGTGTYMGLLSDEYSVEGFDYSEEQVAEAKVRLPGKRVEVADMVDFDMGKQYDVVVCLFSSIGYAETKDRLDSAISAMSRHTKPGGLVLVEPWLRREDVVPGHESHEVKTANGMTVVRDGAGSIVDNLTVLDMVNRVQYADGHNEVFREIHKLAMYSDEDFIDAYKKAGLEIEIDPVGLTSRRLCIGKKPL